MNTKWLIILVIILVVLLVGAFVYFQEPNEIATGGETEELSVQDWILNMNYPIANSGISNLVALPIECYKNGVRNNRNIDKNYISNSADYIIVINVSRVNISEGKRTFVFEVVNLEKGELNYTLKTLQISNNYNSRVWDDSPFQKFDESKHYRINIRNVGNQSEFVCEAEGIEELFLY